MGNAVEERAARLAVDTQQAAREAAQFPQAASARPTRHSHKKQHKEQTGMFFL
jgi:hypothetical protein